MRITFKAILLASSLLGAAASAQSAGINVLSGWYGQSCQASHGNVTSHLKSRCDGKASCQYVVDAGILGDPAPGCSKNYVALFSCQGQASVRLAQLGAESNGRMITLSCEPQAANRAQ